MVKDATIDHKQKCKDYDANGDFLIFAGVDETDNFFPFRKREIDRFVNVANGKEAELIVANLVHMMSCVVSIANRICAFGKRHCFATPSKKVFDEELYDALGQQGRELLEYYDSEENYLVQHFGVILSSITDNSVHAKRLVFKETQSGKMYHVKGTIAELLYYLSKFRMVVKDVSHFRDTRARKYLWLPICDHWLKLQFFHVFLKQLRDWLV